MTRDEALTAIGLGIDLAPEFLNDMHAAMIATMDQPGNLPRLQSCYVLAMFLGGTATGLLEALDDPSVNVPSLQGFDDIPRWTPMLRAAADLLDEVHGQFKKPLMNGHDS